MHLPMYSIRIFALEMKVKDVVDVHENWQAKVSCQHACMQKLSLLGQAVIS